MRTAFAVVLVLFGLAALSSPACNQSEAGSMPTSSYNRSTTDIASSRPEFSPTDYWPQSSDSFNVVIRSQEEWHSLSTEHALWLTYGRLDIAPQPDIDFDSEMLIFMSGGVHLTGGYSLNIRSVTLCDHKLVVTYEEQSPGPDDVVTQAFTYTGDIIEVSRYDLPVEFVRTADPL